MGGFVRYIGWLETMVGTLGVCLPGGRADEPMLTWQCSCNQVNVLTVRAFGLAS